ncbi:hypothetical protein LTR53_010959 [Teratosphaeriaceae sp. CCFEE 6253]|nr:hypothetical protein LTR53_010959 [Teratosphaeriaceae sp. CCFEE 6253]
MWLINTTTLGLEYKLNVERDEPPYAILSHTWTDDEVDHRDFVNTPERAQQRAGYAKIVMTCRQARKDVLSSRRLVAWIMADNGADQDQAINSMYRWYENAVICYVYLADMPDHGTECDLEAEEHDELLRQRLAHYDLDYVDCKDGNPSFENGPLQGFRRSRWFNRGWTLQELIAPSKLTFYGTTWNLLGSRAQLAGLLSSITSIDAKVLLHAGSPRRVPPSQFAVSVRLSWAAGRCTSRPEDRAYSLLGLFGINMPLLYGEGKKAFVRLQEEIIRSSNDLSIFAWQSVDEALAIEKHQLLAPSPDSFDDALSRKFVKEPRAQEAARYALTNRGLEIQVMHPRYPAIARGHWGRLGSRTMYSVNTSLAILGKDSGGPSNMTALRLSRDGDRASSSWHVDNPRLCIVPETELSEGKSLTVVRFTPGPRGLRRAGPLHEPSFGAP